jgi:hypothetical protein
MPPQSAMRPVLPNSSRWSRRFNTVAGIAAIGTGAHGVPTIEDTCGDRTTDDGLGGPSIGRTFEDMLGGRTIDVVCGVRPTIRVPTHTQDIRIVLTTVAPSSTDPAHSSASGRSASASGDALRCATGASNQSGPPRGGPDVCVPSMITKSGNRFRKRSCSVKKLKRDCDST